MKAYVITIMDNERSVKFADRCIKSAAKFGLEVEKWRAITPKDNPTQMMIEEGIPIEKFDEIYSRVDNCRACFLSHYGLWQLSAQTNENIVIFEHDAIVTGKIPNEEFNGIMTFSKPSYGKYNTPTKIGVDGLMQKPYFGGAHGYMVNPNGAKRLIEKSKTHAGPTDVFMNLNNFPDLQEYYPWVCFVADKFSTIQNKNGIVAKHNYNLEYKIIDA